MKKFYLGLTFLFFTFAAKAQITTCNCSANISGNVNFSAVVWTGSGCPTAGSTSYTGNLCVDLAGGANLTMNKDFNITGSFKITNNGNSRFTILPNMDLGVSGNMGDDTNNNVSFVVDGTLTVGGTLYGKNGNDFSGGGAVTAGALNFGNNTTCTNPANCSGIDWNVTTCSPATDPFCIQVKALPVTLLYFDAKINAQTIELSWATATEQNSSHFVVERSIDGKQFHEVGRQKAAGNSLLQKEYSLTDKFPLVGRSYYRLKEVDLDGYTEHFNMRFVDFSGKKGITIYPNPLSNAEDITIALNFSNEETSFVRISDLSGHEVRNFTFSGTETRLPFKPAKGIYIITVSTGKDSYVARIIVP
jgi:hypothetical protein